MQASAPNSPPAASNWESSPAAEHLVGQVPLFAALPAGEIRLLTQALRPVEFAADTLLFREGEHGDRFYVVIAGQVEIIKALGTPERSLLGVRGPGEYIGEMSLLNPAGRRTASARARTPARLLEMTRADFDALLVRQPTLAYAMVRVLSERLNDANTNIVQALQAKNQQLSAAYEALQTAYTQLVEKEKLEHELQVAREVQAGLLPRRLPQWPGWEFAAAWQPAREVSGDFYDFFPVASGRLEAGGLVIADVSGKGMPAALFMAMARSTLRGSVSGAASPAAALSLANRLIHADSAQGSMFVTLFYAELDPAGGRLTYVNAGHTPPWLYHAAADTWRELPRTGPALGLFLGAPYQQVTLTLEPGDSLVLYTDGLTDATNPSGARYDAAAARAVLHTHRRAAAPVLAAALEAAMEDFRAGQPLYDDITLVVIKRV